MVATWTLLATLLWTAQGAGAAGDRVGGYFSPREGREAFEQIFSAIARAEQSVYVTVYSWKMSRLKASLASALSGRFCRKFKSGKQAAGQCLSYQPKTPAAVYLILDKRHEQQRLKDINELEQLGAQVRISTKTMHEKFLIVDGHFMMNTSANFSYGARDKYHENFVLFFDDPSTQGPWDGLRAALMAEFVLIWNAGREQKQGAGFAPHHRNLKSNTGRNPLLGSDSPLEFLSSSMNFKVKKLSTPQADGSFTVLHRRGSSRVTDRIVYWLDQAQHSIEMSVNYLLLDALYQALKRAHDRGVVVRIINDNKSANKGKDYSNAFARYVRSQDSQTPAPTRFKFYSFFPTSGKSYLNHNKYLLIDYAQDSKTPVGEGTVLISGSHNLSRTAEVGQFDNMIVYKTPQFSALYSHFSEDFELLWGQGRGSDDQPSPAIWNYYLTPVRGKYRIHSTDIDQVLSLTGGEITRLKRALKKLAPAMLDRKVPRQLLEDCWYYSPGSRKYYDRSHRECRP